LDRLGAKFWTAQAPQVGQVRNRGLDDSQAPNIGRFCPKSCVLGGFLGFGVGEVSCGVWCWCGVVLVWYLLVEVGFGVWVVGFGVVFGV